MAAVGEERGLGDGSLGDGGLDRDEFVQRFGHVLEDSPHLAAAAWRRGPSADAAGIAAAFAAVLDDLDHDDLLTLLRAHPELGARGPMGADSRREQASAGLDRDDGHDADDTLDRLRAGNEAYRERFGFPFIIAVSGRTPAEVLAELRRRLERTPAEELVEARRQVSRIAELRIATVVEAAS